MTTEMEEQSREVIITPEQIRERIGELADEIAEKYKGKRLLLIGVLKGAFILTADISRELFNRGLDDVEIDFISISSYDKNTESSKNPRLLKDVDTDITGRHVLLIEDIIDTGHSLAALKTLLSNRGTASLETLCLLTKKIRREVQLPVEYVGFEVDVWVEGYGLDSNQYGRANPAIVKVMFPY